MKRLFWRGLLLSGLMLVVWGCDDASSPEVGVEFMCGNGGQILNVGITQSCVYDNPLLIETGFECPPELPHMHVWGNVTICSDSEELPNDFYDALEGRYPERDFPERCQDQVCDLGEVCVEGMCVEAEVDACDAIACASDERCVDGACVPLDDPCDGVTCPPNARCVEGQCVEVDACDGVECDAGMVCVEGACISDDPCAGVECSEGMQCVEGACAPLPGPCGDFPELAVEENVLDNGFMATYRTTEDNWRTVCVDEGFENGKDRGVQFTAPSAGDWLLMASGQHLWSFSARASCEEVEELSGCDSNTSFHGDDPFGAAKGFRVALEEGERVYLNLDGCPMASCSYDVRAIQPVLEGDACNAGWGGWRIAEEPENGCAEGTLCPNVEAPVCLAITAPEIVRDDEATAYRVEGSLRVKLYGRDTSLDVRQAKVEWLDADGEPMPWYVEGPTQGLRYPVDSPLGEAFAFRFKTGEFDVDPAIIPLTASVRVVLVDGEELESEPLVIEVTEDIPMVNEGASCDREAIDDHCEEGTLCRQLEAEGPWSCVRPIAPTVISARVAINMELNSYAVDMEGMDPNNDARRFTINFLDSDGDVVETAMRFLPEDGAGGTFALSASAILWRQEATLALATRAQVVVQDREGLDSEPLEVTFVETASVGRGDACDPVEARNRCEGEALCDGLFVDGARETARCHALVSECADGVDAVDMNTHNEGEGLWRYQGDLSGRPALAGCQDQSMVSGQGTEALRFTAPSEGVFRITASVFEESNPQLIVRRHCQYPGRTSEISCNEFGDYHEGTTWTVVTLEAEETIYILVDDYVSDRAYTLTISPEM